MLYKEIKSITSQISQAERNISLYGLQSLYGTAKDWNLWILPSTHGHAFCLFHWELGSSHSGSAGDRKGNFRFRNG